MRSTWIPLKDSDRLGRDPDKEMEGDHHEQIPRGRRRLDGLIGTTPAGLPGASPGSSATLVSALTEASTAALESQEQQPKQPPWAYTPVQDAQKIPKQSFAGGSASGSFGPSSSAIPPPPPAAPSPPSRRSETRQPKNEILGWYGSRLAKLNKIRQLQGRPQIEAVSEHCWYTWDDGGAPHLRRYTSLFTCPVSAERFPSGAFGNEKLFSVVPASGNGGHVVYVVWYTKKKLAEHAAARRALDCFAWREGHQNAAQCREDPYAAWCGPPLPPTPIPLHQVWRPAEVVCPNWPEATEASPRSSETENPFEASQRITDTCVGQPDTHASDPYHRHASNPYHSNASHPQASNAHLSQVFNAYHQQAPKTYHQQASNRYAPDPHLQGSTVYHVPVRVDASMQHQQIGPGNQHQQIGSGEQHPHPPPQELKQQPQSSQYETPSGESSCNDIQET